MKLNLKISTALLWVFIYFGFMLLYTFLDITIWRKITPLFSEWLNLISILFFVSCFLLLLNKKTNYNISLLNNTNLKNIILAFGCSALFYLLLDNCIDPFLENLFPSSEQSYQQTVQALFASPVTSFLQLCIIAPVLEEILMRDFVLGGLKNLYGVSTALFISSVLFALLHFNTVQTLSALVCGVILGLLYIKTDSILCCILAHSGYNLISYISLFYQQK